MAKKKSLARAYDDQTYAELAKAMAVTDPYTSVRTSRSRDRTNPVYSTGQGFAQLAGDLGEAYLEKETLKDAKAVEDKGYKDLAGAMTGVLAPNLDQGPPMPPEMRGNVELAKLLESNPRIGAQYAPQIMEMARNMKPPSFTGELGPNQSAFIDGKQVARGESQSGLLTPEEEQQKIRIAQASRTSEKEPGAGKAYQDTFGGAVEPGMQPEVIGGKLTGKLTPIPGGAKDPAVIEAKRVAELEVSLPKTEGAINQATKDFDSTIKAIDDILLPENADGVGDITGFGGTSAGKALTLPGGNAAKVQALVNQLKGRSFLSGLSTLKASSPSGASGLGALSESEGKRVLEAQAPIDQAQSDDDFRIALKNYREALVSSRDNIRDTFEREYAPVRKKPLSGATTTSAPSDPLGLRK